MSIKACNCAFACHGYHGSNCIRRAQVTREEFRLDPAASLALAEASVSVDIVDAEGRTRATLCGAPTAKGAT